MPGAEWCTQGIETVDKVWQDGALINRFDPWKVGWLFEAPRGVKMA